MTSIDQDPIEAITLYQIAIEMSDRGNQDLAAEIIRIAATLEPKFESAYCNMGSCCDKFGQFSGGTGVPAPVPGIIPKSPPG
jgi:hypothetical protein